MRHSTVEVLCVCALAAACTLIAMVQQGCDSSNESGSPELASLPEAAPEDVWKYITEDNPYREWSTFPSDRIPDFAVWKDDYLTCWLSGNVTRIYVNDIALAALDEEPRDMPHGSIILGEVYNILADETVDAPWLIAGFYKVEGSTARDNDWLSFEYGPDGSLVYTCASVSGFGTKTRCYSCHEASENDYIWIDSPKFDAERSQVPTLDECEVRP